MASVCFNENTNTFDALLIIYAKIPTVYKISDLVTFYTVLASQNSGSVCNSDVQFGHDDDGLLSQCC